MYEPKRIPLLTKSTEPLPALRYGIQRADSFIDLEDPTIDPLHIHSYLEIFFSIDAEVSFLVNDAFYPVGVGDLIISRPGDVHVCIFPKSAAYKYYCLWIDTDFSSALFSFLHKKDFSPLVSLESKKAVSLNAMLDALYTLTDEEKNSVQEISMLFSVLSSLSKAHGTSERNAEVPVVLSDIISFVKQDFTDIRTVADITKKFFISVSTLNRYFRTYLHTTPREYIEAQKLAYAMELLNNGASVTESCAEAGFADCSHFIVLFKKKFGNTPLKYKKRLQAKDSI